MNRWQIGRVRVMQVVDTDHRPTDELRLAPTPGHTPGPVGVRIESGGRRAAIGGGLMHHPLQCSEPARSTRCRFLACCAADRSLVLG